MSGGTYRRLKRWAQIEGRMNNHKLGQFRTLVPGRRAEATCSVCGLAVQIDVRWQTIQGKAVVPCRGERT